jgi:hypothetical protein
MRPFTTKDDLRAAAREAGLGDLGPDELALLKTFHDDACAFGDALRNAIVPEDEPATVFPALGAS